LWNLLFQWVPEVKRQGSEADHSRSTSAEDKKTQIYISTPPHAFLAQEQIYFLLIFTSPSLSDAPANQTANKASKYLH
jgi:hypothetical protein